METSVEPQLFESGIQTEHSDVRAHVSVVNRTIYVFKTQVAVQAIAEWNPPLRPASQPDVKYPTAEGWLMPVSRIPGLRKLNAVSWPCWTEFNEQMTTSDKGALAVECVLYAMRAGRFPFWVDAYEDDRANVQLKGTDIVVFCRKRVQVKCDWRCGDGPPTGHGTGNVFLQRAELNPLKRH